METEKSTEKCVESRAKRIKENVENQAYQISQERALEMLEELFGTRSVRITSARV